MRLTQPKFSASKSPIHSILIGYTNLQAWLERILRLAPQDGLWKLSSRVGKASQSALALSPGLSGTGVD